MRSLKFPLFLMLLVVILAAVVGPVLWLYTAATLPVPIETKNDIESNLRQIIESERQSLQATRAVRERVPVRWDTPDITRIPKHVLAIYTNENGCPTYFQTPKEGPLKWGQRLVRAFGRTGMAGDGSCELYFARRLARQLRATSTFDETVAADRIRKLLTKEELVAYDLQSAWLQRGLVGIDVASRDLLQKELLDLSLAEMAELMLAMAPYEQWDIVRQCSNHVLITQNRDVILWNLQQAGLITQEQYRSAQALPPRCLSVRR